MISVVPFDKSDKEFRPPSFCVNGGYGFQRDERVRPGGGGVPATKSSPAGPLAAIWSVGDHDLHSAPSGPHFRG
ncbi:hypothetical protein GCM10011358_30540 [Sinisalibacter lacisalsi]|uniref:Uncharacterized protein n=1 Tax=Sinisalibacter lacisalsi TaxID=1526570 RepID=A0ABQ1QT62_9RHOB|nr:hypothetical protein GCM10011358_30540 [Sinisalibacter lacisalsi]